MRVSRLRHERTKRGQSQTVTAAVIGIPQATLSHIEILRLKPTPQQLQRIADVFNLAPDQVLELAVGGALQVVGEGNDCSNDGTRSRS